LQLHKKINHKKS